MFVHFHGERVILLLSGYDKGDDPSDRRQEKAIARARQFLTEWRSQETRRKAISRKSPGQTPKEASPIVEIGESRRQAVLDTIWFIGHTR